MSSNKKTLRFGVPLEKGDFYLVITRRENSYTNDYWDANWLVASARIEGTDEDTACNVALRADDLQYLLDELALLESNKKTGVNLTTMEEDLNLAIAKSPLGMYAVDVRVNCSSDPALNRSIATSVSSAHIREMIHDLREIVDVFPVIGERA